MIDKMKITTGPCPTCDKTVQMDATGIIARHECAGRWILGAAAILFDTKLGASGLADATYYNERTRIIPRRGKWAIQVWKPANV